MQAMAKLQAAAGSAAAGGDDVYPFSTLAVWRDKLRCDLRSADAGPGFRATLLMQQVWTAAAAAAAPLLVWR
jgi:hypothetical protein